MISIISRAGHLRNLLLWEHLVHGNLLKTHKHLWRLLHPIPSRAELSSSWGPWKWSYSHFGNLQPLCVLSRVLKSIPKMCWGICRHPLKRAPSRKHSWRGSNWHVSCPNPMFLFSVSFLFHQGCIIAISFFQTKSPLSGDLSIFKMDPTKTYLSTTDLHKGRSGFLIFRYQWDSSFDIKIHLEARYYLKHKKIYTYLWYVMSTVHLCDILPSSP